MYCTENNFFLNRPSRGLLDFQYSGGEFDKGMNSGWVDTPIRDMSTYSLSYSSISGGKIQHFWEA